MLGIFVIFVEKVMYIISDKIVITRKKHNCSACGRVFGKGTKMRLQVNTSDGIQTWRECPTCIELLDNHRSYFDDDYDVCSMNCVAHSLDRDQTPEELLILLNETKKITI